MKCAAIADTHGRIEGWECPPCDVLIHAGDLTASGSYEESCLWLGILMGTMHKVGAKHLLIVPGNHDEAFQTRLPELRQLLAQYTDKAHILVDEGITIDGKTFYGTPWTPTFCDWHYMGSEDFLAERFTHIPHKLDVLISHGPPYGYLDPGFLRRNAGSQALMSALLNREIKHHVFGHLHAAGGLTKRFANLDTGVTTELHNVACVNEAYKVVRGPKVFEI